MSSSCVLTSQLLITDRGHTISVARAPVVGVRPENFPHLLVPIEEIPFHSLHPSIHITV